MFSLVIKGLETNEERLLLELETAKNKSHENEQEKAKLESSRKMNEARIAALESEKELGT